MEYLAYFKDSVNIYMLAESFRSGELQEKYEGAGRKCSGHIHTCCHGRVSRTRVPSGDVMKSIRLPPCIKWPNGSWIMHGKYLFRVLRHTVRRRLIKFEIRPVLRKGAHSAVMQIITFACTWQKIHAYYFVNPALRNSTPKKGGKAKQHPRILACHERKRLCTATVFKRLNKQHITIKSGKSILLG